LRAQGGALALSLSLTRKLHPCLAVPPRQNSTPKSLRLTKANGSLPAQIRAAFARKVDWFRLLARVGEKRERAALMANDAKRKAQEPLPNPFLAPTKQRRFVGRVTQS